VCLRSSSEEDDEEPKRRPGWRERWQPVEKPEHEKDHFDRFMDLMLSEEEIDDAAFERALRKDPFSMGPVESPREREERMKRFDQYVGRRDDDDDDDAKKTKKKKPPPMPKERPTLESIEREERHKIDEAKTKLELEEDDDDVGDVGDSEYGESEPQDELVGDESLEGLDLLVRRHQIEQRKLQSAARRARRERKPPSTRKQYPQTKREVDELENEFRDDPKNYDEFGNYKSWNEEENLAGNEDPGAFFDRVADASAEKGEGGSTRDRRRRPGGRAGPGRGGRYDQMIQKDKKPPAKENYDGSDDDQDYQLSVLDKFLQGRPEVDFDALENDDPDAVNPEYVGYEDDDDYQDDDDDDDYYQDEDDDDDEEESFRARSRSRSSSYPPPAEVDPLEASIMKQIARVDPDVVDVDREYKSFSARRSDRRDKEKFYERTPAESRPREGRGGFAEEPVYTGTYDDESSSSSDDDDAYSRGSRPRRRGETAEQRDARLAVEDRQRRNEYERMQSDFHDMTKPIPAVRAGGDPQEVVMAVLAKIQVDADAAYYDVDSLLGSMNPDSELKKLPYKMLKNYLTTSDYLALFHWADWRFDKDAPPKLSNDREACLVTTLLEDNREDGKWKKVRWNLSLRDPPGEDPDFLATEDKVWMIDSITVALGSQNVPRD